MAAWWAFWRRRAAPPGPGVAPATGADVPAPARRRPQRDERDEDRAPTPAFSGARPDPGAGLEIDPAVEPDEVGELAPVDVERTQAALLELVQACHAGDGSEVLAAHRRVCELGPEAVEVAAFAAVVALGVQLRTASGHRPGGRAAGPLEVQAAAAQGEAVAGRAAGLLRVVAPHCSRDTVRRVVGLASGVAERDVPQAQGDVPQSDQLLLGSVLTGQALRDGGDLADVLEAVGRALGD